MNKWTGGWSGRKTKRLIYSNGYYPLSISFKPGNILRKNSEFDPWRETGVSATGRPGGPMKSTPETPILIVPGGFHTSDLRVSNGHANPGVMEVINAEVAQIKTWVEEYYQEKKN